jgi:hypothetical protein
MANKIDTSVVTPGLTGNQFFPVKVGKLILDGSTNFAAQYGGYDAIGTIFYTRVTSKAKLVENENFNEANIDTRFDGIARPLFPFMRYYPLINEIVLVLTTISKDSIGGGKETQDYYLPNINIWNHPHHNNYPSIENYTELEIRNNKEYQKAGLLRRITEESKIPDVPLGDYFKERINIKPLLPYEGDLIFEGRHGNSLRFGSTSKSTIIPKEQENNYSYGSGENGDPIIIIRNGQSEGLDGQGWIPTIEDINRDPSSIYLTSNQVIAEFIPSSLNWKSYKAIIALNPQDEVQEFIVSPVDFLTADPTKEEEAIEIADEIDEEYNKDDSVETEVTEITGNAEEEVVYSETELNENEMVNLLPEVTVDGNAQADDDEITAEEFLAEKRAQENAERGADNLRGGETKTETETEDTVENNIEKEEDKKAVGSMYDELEANFEEDELMAYVNTAVSGDEYRDEKEQKPVDWKGGTGGGSGGGGGGGDGGKATSTKGGSHKAVYGDAPNGYPCTIIGPDGKEHNMHRPITGKEMAEVIINAKKKGDPWWNWVNGGNRIINQGEGSCLALHTTAGNLSQSHIDLAWQIYGRGWNLHGYHISIQSDGTCMFNLPFSGRSWGIGGFFNPNYGPGQKFIGGQSNAINISWIGGSKSFDMTAWQALSYKQVTLAIVKRFPKIKVLGHNQGAAKSCPRWWVPEYAKLIGIKPENIEYDRWVCTKYKTLSSGKKKCIEFKKGKAITEKSYFTNAKLAAEYNGCNRAVYDFPINKADWTNKKT